MTAKAFLILLAAAGALIACAVCLHTPAGIHFLRSLHGR
jgi:hypothetical protein